MNRRAFTLAELMIVIGIMVLMLAIAIPVFNVMTGSRSVESAQNAIAAALGQARLRAISSQSPHGLVFYRDAATDRVAIGLARLHQETVGTAPHSGRVLELVPESDVQFLPRGVGIGFRNGLPDGNTADNFAPYTYDSIGFGTDDDTRLYGAILFDARGHFSFSQYAVEDNGVLGSRLEGGKGLNSHLIRTGYPSASSGEFLHAQPAFLLFDASGVSNVADNLADSKDDDTSGFYRRERFLNDNATVVLVNRYNGTLTRSE